MALVITSLKRTHFDYLCERLNTVVDSEGAPRALITFCGRVVTDEFHGLPFCKVDVYVEGFYRKASTLHVLPLRHNLQKDKPNRRSASDHGKAYSLVDSPAFVDEACHPVVNNDVALMMLLWEE
jgi:hypothetical protein